MRPSDFRRANSHLSDGALSMSYALRSSLPTRKVTCPKCTGGGDIFDGVDDLHKCKSCGGSGWAKFEIVKNEDS